MYLAVNGYILEMLKTNSIQFDPIMSPDGTDFMYTRVLIDVTCTYSPGATAVDQFGLQHFGYNPNAPVYADVTATELKQRLAVPRNLWIFSGDNAVMLVSPPVLNGVQCAVDAKDGPKCLGVSVVAITNSRNFLVRWRGETFISDCIVPFIGLSSNVPPLVSNRWSQSQTIEQPSLRTTILTEGTAVFRSDLLDYLGQINGFSVGADYFRDFVIPPCPLGFKRTNGNVNVTPLGNVLSWRVVDVEQAVNIGSLVFQAYGVTSFDGVYGQHSQRIGSDIAMTGPFFTETLDARCHGHMRSSKKNLLRFLAVLAVEQMNLPPPGSKPSDFAGFPIIGNLSIRESLDEKWMSIHVEALCVPGKTFAPALQGVDPNHGRPVSGGLNPDWLGVDDIGTLTDPTGRNPNPQYDNGTRATYWGQMFTQAVLQACNVPFSPTQGNCITSILGDNFTVSCAPAADNGSTLPLNGDLVAPIHLSGLVPHFNMNWVWGCFGGRIQNPATGGIPDSWNPGGGGPGGPLVRGVPAAPDSSDAPVVGPEIMQIFSPYTTLTINWEVLSINNDPPLPHPVSNEPGYVLLDFKPTTWVPYIYPDMNSAGYLVQGSFTYALKFPIAPGDPLPMGASPAYTLGWSEVKDTDWLHLIIDEG